MIAVKNEQAINKDAKEQRHVDKVVAASHKTGKYATLLAFLFLFFRNLCILWCNN